MNVEQAQEALDDYGAQLQVVVVMPDGTHVKVEAVEPVTTDGGYPAAGIII